VRNCRCYLVFDNRSKGYDNGSWDMDPGSQADREWDDPGSNGWVYCQARIFTVE
jgi:hypothetical protein